MEKLIATLEKELVPVKHCGNLMAYDKSIGHGTCRMKGKITAETCMACRQRRAA